MDTLQFAEYELLRYTAEMGIYPEITLSVNAKRFDQTHFWRFDAELDDAFSVSVKDGKGEICATNSRAVLMGVYHFLKMQGCRFLRPGREGEYVPCIDRVRDGEEVWYAHARHRGSTDGYCGGGLDGMLAFIDWLPKMMMNSYFIEMTDFYHDMKGSYLWENHPYKSARSLSREQFAVYESLITKEIGKRSLLRHGAGHGWTNMLMEGITEIKRSISIRRDDDKTPCQNPGILAEIDGKRELYTGVPLNTNLCLSQESVRKAFAKKVYEYSKEHPEITYLHVWLADAYSNFCECKACREKTPADWYVMLLNDIDAELTKHGSRQRIVFLTYFELLYPPKTERIRNEERFTLLFCPYGRDFTRRYRDWKELPFTPAPLNHFQRSDMHMGLYLAELRAWREIFGGDTIVFDYNLYDGATKVDITNLLQAPILADDCLFLKNIGIHGRIECGSTRSMVPTALWWHAMSEALFYGRTYSETEYFRNAFGVGEPVSQFLQEMKDVLPVEYMLCRRTYFLPGESETIRTALKKIDAFRDVLTSYTPHVAFHRRNCELFGEYLDSIEAIFSILLKKADGITEEELETEVETYKQLVYRKELSMPLYMDGDNWFFYMRNAFRSRDERNEF